MKEGIILKLTLISFVVLVSFFTLHQNEFGAGFILAPTVNAKGLVPCGGEEEPECDLCCFLTMIKNIVDFLLYKLVGPLFFALIVIGAIILLVGGASPNLLEIGKKAIISAVIGAVIIFTSWLIVSSILTATSFNQADSWYKFNCGCGEAPPPPPPTYLACDNLACVEREGDQSDECSTDKDCWYFTCDESSMCVKAEGQGPDECHNENYSCLVECNNGIDDDGDGKIDFPQDPACTSPGDNSESGGILPKCYPTEGFDNDGDGKIDFPEDPGCESPMDNSETNPNIQCDDGEDNDGDGKVDYRPVAGVGDPGCEDLLDNDETDVTNCNDGVDNDNDGWTDMADPGCQEDPSSELNPSIQCDNGQDDDGDGKIDYKIDGSGDQQCQSPLDNNEANGLPICNDGKDNDNDGRIDYPDDPGCLNLDDNSEKDPNGPQCDDGKNNDDPQDNLIDYPEDPECTGPADNDEWDGQEEETCDNQCREGITGCDPAECHGYTGLNGSQCHFDQNGIWLDYCYECVGGPHPVNSCSDYLSKQSCNQDICGIDGCLWEGGGWFGGGSCGEEIVDPFQGYTFQVDERQKNHASQALMDLLSCMKNKIPAEAREISSISDDGILADPPTCTYLNCSGNICGGCDGCAHTCSSCHYGGVDCNTEERFSYAVDFAREEYCSQLKTAALECNADAWVDYEGNHVHISVGHSLCNCNEQDEGFPCP